MDTHIPVSSPLRGQPTPETLQHTSEDVQKNKDFAALSYVPVLSVLLYVLLRQSPFVRHHARQGNVLFILAVLFWLIPYAGKVLELFVLAEIALGFAAAAQGRWMQLPLIGPLSERKFKAAWQDIKHLPRLVGDSLSVLSTPQPKPTAPSPLATDADTSTIVKTEKPASDPLVS